MKSGILKGYGLSLITVLIFVAIYYPGFMSQDSLGQYEQARSGNFSDWHPPLMSYLWSGFIKMGGGVSSLLYFHLFLFFVGLGTWIRSYTFKTQVLLCASFLFIPVLGAEVGTLWKDVGMALSYFCVAGCLLYPRKTRISELELLFQFILLAYGTSIRHNAVFAAFPLYVLWVYRGVLPNLSYLKRPLRLSLVFGGLTLLAQLFLTSILNENLSHGDSTYPVQQIWMHDLAGISLRTKEIQIPQNFAPLPLKLSDVEKLYSPNTVVTLYCCQPEALSFLKSTQNSSELGELREAWFHSVIHHPKAYLQHRLKVFRELLGMHRPQVCAPFHLGIDVNSLGLVHPHGFLNRIYLKYLDFWKNSFFFRGYWILLGNIFLLVRLFRRKVPYSQLDHSLLLLSGLLYALAYLFIATTCDVRMLFWTHLVTWTVALDLLARSKAWKKSASLSEPLQAEKIS